MRHRPQNFRKKLSTWKKIGLQFFIRHNITNVHLGSAHGLTQNFDKSGVRGSISIRDTKTPDHGKDYRSGQREQPPHGLVLL